MGQVIKGRGFLSGWPEDVVAVVNGRPFTKSDVLDGKRKCQSRELAAKRRSYEPQVKPCFIWTFFNENWIYHGWWLYVRTRERDWKLVPRDNEELILKVMAMFPCGLESSLENYDEWKIAFARAHSHPTKKRPDGNGLAVARAVVEPGGRLLDVFPWIE